MRHVLHLLETNAATATMASKTLVMVTSSIAKMVVALAVLPVIVPAVLEAQVHIAQTAQEAQVHIAQTAQEAQAHIAQTVQEAQAHTVLGAQVHIVLVDHLVLEVAVIPPGETKTRDDLL